MSDLRITLDAEQIAQHREHAQEAASRIALTEQGPRPRPARDQVPLLIISGRNGAVFAIGNGLPVLTQDGKTAVIEAKTDAPPHSFNAIGVAFPQNGETELRLQNGALAWIRPKPIEPPPPAPTETNKAAPKKLGTPPPAGSVSPVSEPNAPQTPCLAEIEKALTRASIAGAFIGALKGSNGRCGLHFVTTAENDDDNATRHQTIEDFVKKHCAKGAVFISRMTGVTDAFKTAHEKLA